MTGRPGCTADQAAVTGIASALLVARRHPRPQFRWLFGSRKLLKTYLARISEGSACADGEGLINLAPTS